MEEIHLDFVWVPCFAGYKSFNHEEHEGHEEAGCDGGILFVLFVFFVVNRLSGVLPTSALDPQKSRKNRNL